MYYTIIIRDNFSIIKKIILTASIVGMFALAAPSFAVGTPDVKAGITTSTTTSATASCMKDATTKKNTALKSAKTLTNKASRKAAIKAAKQQFIADRKDCKSKK